MSGPRLMKKPPKRLTRSSCESSLEKTLFHLSLTDFLCWGCLRIRTKAEEASDLIRSVFSEHTIIYSFRGRIFPCCQETPAPWHSYLLKFTRYMKYISIFSLQSVMGAFYSKERGGNYVWINKHVIFNSTMRMSRSIAQSRRNGKGPIAT